MKAASYSDFLQVSHEGPVVFLTWNRPENENRFAPAEIAEYDQFLRDANADPNVRVIVQTGAGDTWFSAGPLQGTFGSEDSLADGIPDTARDAALASTTLHHGWMREFLEFPKPLITVLNGDIMAKPLTYALLSDILIAEQHVRLRDMHVISGLSSITGPMLWPMSAGLMKAKRWIMTGDWMDAATAEEIGLVTEVVPSGTGMARGRVFAERFASLRPETLWLTKRSLNAWITSHNDDIFVPGLIAEIGMLPRKKPAT